MPSSAIHVLWLCRKPWGVSPSLTGSQQASGASLAGCSPLPGQSPAAFLWATVLPSRRNLTAYPQAWRRPEFSVLISRGEPRPDGVPGYRWRPRRDRDAWPSCGVHDD